MDNLDNITVEMCSEYTYTLPDISDPENDTFIVSVDDHNSYWMLIESNNLKQKLVINSNKLNKLDKNTDYSIKIKIEDSTGAFTNYYLNLTVLKRETPYLDNIQDIVYPKVKDLEVKIHSEIELSKVILKMGAFDCEYKPISWVETYLRDNMALIKLKPSNLVYGEFCSVIVVETNCNCIKRFESNKFKISVSHYINHPPVCTNSIHDIVLYSGQQIKAVKLPHDLFYDVDNDPLKYFSTGCLDSYSLNLATTIEEKMNINTLYVYIKESKIGKCEVSISVTDTSDESCMLLANVIVKSCASKDCIYCDGSLQENCLTCNDGYSLEKSTGVCLESHKYQDFSFDDYFIKLGFLHFLSILLPIVLYMLYGKIALYPVIYIQIVIAVIFSREYKSQNIIQYFNWLQIYKLDFGFLNSISMINNTPLCVNQDSTRFLDVQFYCSGFIINFANFILLVTVICIICVLSLFVIKLFPQSKFAEYSKRLVIKVFTGKFIWELIQKILIIFSTLMNHYCSFISQKALYYN